MKKNLCNKTICKSFLSLIILTFYFIIAVSSWDLILDSMYKGETEYLGNGVYRAYQRIDAYERETRTGTKDIWGRWHGSLVIENRLILPPIVTKEEGEFVHGKRDGKHIITTTVNGIETTKYECYDMDNRLPSCPPKNAFINSEETSAFNILSNKYPWYLRSLNSFGFEESQVEAYMDTLETIISTYEFEKTEFDGIYQNAYDALDGTNYESVASVNGKLFLSEGFEKIKNAEFRMGVVDSRRSEEKTYDIIKSTYPNYYLSSNYTVYIPDSIFRIFCHDFDSLMVSYGPLDKEDPFFVDSVDSRMYKALDFLWNYEESSSEEFVAIKSALINKQHLDYGKLQKSIDTKIELLKIDSLSSAIAELVSYDLFTYLLQGDIVRLCVKESYFINSSIIGIPTVTTKFSENNSDVSVDIVGNIIEDGGAEVTERGIIWATIYNPTADDNVVQSGTGTGEYRVTINGLLPGKVYYARSYAVNSAGMAYGNCIEFTTLATGSIELIYPEIDFTVYPNPASQEINVDFCIESTETVEVMFVNMKGQIVFHKEYKGMPPGQNQFKIGLSDFENGIYYCRLLNESKISSKKIVVIR